MYVRIVNICLDRFEALKIIADCQEIKELEKSLGPVPKKNEKIIVIGT